MRKKSVAIYLGSSLLIAGIAFILFYLPLPYKTYAQGVIYVPQEAYIRAQTEGFVDKVYIENDSEIGVGDTILELDSPGLESRAEVLRAQLDEARFRYEASVNNRTESEILLQEYRYLEQEYWDVTNRLSNLTIKSPASGNFVFAYRNSEEGRFYNRGEIIGFLVDFETLPLAAMISEDDIDRVRSETHAVTLKLASQPNKEYPSKILRQVPSSTRTLPSYVLSTEGGGLIALDPNRTTDLESYNSYFRVELDSKAAPLDRFDERVHVLFEHDPEPIAFRWYRAVRRLLLRQFDV